MKISTEVHLFLVAANVFQNANADTKGLLESSALQKAHRYDAVIYNGNTNFFAYKGKIDRSYSEDRLGIASRGKAINGLKFAERRVKNVVDLTKQYFNDYHLGEYKKEQFLYEQHQQSMKTELDFAADITPAIASFSRPNLAFPEYQVPARKPKEIINMLKKQSISVVINIDLQPGGVQKQRKLPESYLKAFRESRISYIDRPDLKLLDSQDEAIGKKLRDLNRIVHEVHGYLKEGKGIAVYCAYGLGRSKVVQGAVMLYESFHKGTLYRSLDKKTNVFKNNMYDFAQKNKVAPRVLWDAMKKHQPEYYSRVEYRVRPVKAYKEVAKIIESLRLSNPFAIERDYNVELLNLVYESLQKLEPIKYK